MNLMNKNIIVLRSSPGTYVGGIFIESTREEISIKGTIQPDTSNRHAIAEMYDMKQLGKDIDGSINIFTKDILITLDNIQKINPDLVIYKDRNYQVQSSSGLRELGPLKHYKYSAKYIENTEN